MRKLSIACINANGKLREEAIDSVLYYCKHIDLLFITETWLPPGKTIPTTWHQYHLYGKAVSNSYRQQMGISLFINPTSKFNKIYVDLLQSEYYMLCHIDNLKIYCFYLPPFPSLDNNTTMQIINSIPLSNNTILCGDFNARMGKYTGDLRWNPRGSKLSKHIQDNHWYNWNVKCQYGIPTRINYRQQSNTTDNSIVDYFISTSDFQQADLQIKTDLAILGSDHKMLVFSFLWDDLSFADDQQPQQRKKWKVVRLQELDVLQAYRRTLKQQLHQTQLESKLSDFINYLIASSTELLQDQCTDNRSTLEYLTQQFYNCLYYTLDNILTESDYRPKTWRWFWNKSLQTASNYRQACYFRWCRAYGIQKGLWW
ncbi:Endonuclease/exonuclease/phosphatase, partial [Gilbertella persicaria]|uniref:Endonuclease/exonuclease/phosphatase n=1 Tax=Gilbertella persicaria TaxID=101096 RepID=UPI00221FB2E5